MPTPFIFMLPDLSSKKEVLKDSLYQDMSFSVLLETLLERLKPSLPNPDSDHKRLQTFFKEIGESSLDLIHSEAFFKKHEAMLNDPNQYSAVIHVISNAHLYVTKSAIKKGVQNNEQDQIAFLKETKKRLEFINRILSLLNKTTYATSNCSSYNELLSSSFEDINILLSNISRGLYTQFYTEQHQILMSIFEETIAHHFKPFEFALKATMSAAKEGYDISNAKSLCAYMNRWQFFKAQYYFAIGNDTKGKEYLITLGISAQLTHEQSNAESHNWLISEKTWLEMDIKTNKFRAAYAEMLLDINQSLNSLTCQVNLKKKNILRACVKAQIADLKKITNNNIEDIAFIKTCVSAAPLSLTYNQDTPVEIKTLHEEMVLLLTKLLESDKGNVIATLILEKIKLTKIKGRILESSHLEKKVPPPTPAHPSSTPPKKKKAENNQALTALKTKNARLKKEAAQLKSKTEDDLNKKLEEIQKLKAEKDRLEAIQTGLKTELSRFSTKIDDTPLKKLEIEKRELEHSNELLKQDLSIREKQVISQEQKIKQAQKVILDLENQLEAIKQKTLSFQHTLQKNRTQLVTLQSSIPYQTPAKAAPIEEDNSQLIDLQQSIPKLQEQNKALETEQQDIQRKIGDLQLIIERKKQADDQIYQAWLLEKAEQYLEQCAHLPLPDPSQASVAPPQTYVASCAPYQTAPVSARVPIMRSHPAEQKKTFNPTQK